MTAVQLADEDRAVLRLAGEFWQSGPAKEQAIRERFGCTPVRFYQRLHALLDDPAAEAFEPVIVHRLRRIRATRRAQVGGVR